VEHESPVGDRAAVLPPGTIKHDPGDVEPVDPSSGADLVEQEVQAQSPAEADVGGDPARRECQRFDCRRDAGAVGAVEHGSHAPARKAMWMA
jgi:hypothetical protein